MRVRRHQENKAKNTELACPDIQYNGIILRQ